jgi:rhamnosyltransferase subunit B
MPAWFTDAGRSLIWHGLDRFKLQPMAAPLIDDWLSRNGQPTLNAPVFGGWLNSDQQILALFPADFAPVHTDWPVSMKTVGFPLYESALSTASDPELDAFCRRDTLAGALWVVYCGPTSAEQSDLIHARLRRELGTTDRLLWLGQTSPANHSRQRRILVRQSVSLRRVLPFADVFVHHGGIGSCAQGLTAGIKQRIYPFAYDQFDNAWRVAANLKEHPVHRREPPPPEMYSLPNRPNTSVMQALNEMDSLVRPA